MTMTSLGVVAVCRHGARGSGGVHPTVRGDLEEWQPRRIQHPRLSHNDHRQPPQTLLLVRSQVRSSRGHRVI